MTQRPSPQPIEHEHQTQAALLERVEARMASSEPDVEVLAVELAGSRRSPVLRIFVDRPQGIDLGVCARVTNQLRDLLVDYGVEVSSPGPERPLTKPGHYRRYLGRRVRVRTYEQIEGRKDFKGELIDADDEGVALAGEWGTIRIPLERIRRSNLISQAGEPDRGALGATPAESRTTGRSS